MFPLRITLPQHAQDFTCAAKQTGREERCFLGPPLPRAMPSKTGKRKYGQVFLSRKNSSQHAQNCTCAAKPPEQGALFYWTPPATPYAKQDWEGKNRPSFFRQRKTLPNTHKISRAPQKNRNERNTVILNSRHVLCQPRLGRENGAKFFRQGNTLTCTYNISHAPQLTYREERSSP